LETPFLTLESGRILILTGIKRISGYFAVFQSALETMPRFTITCILLSKRTLGRAGIKRRIYPHLFRHTRATILASRVTEGPLEAQMGGYMGKE